MPIRASRVDIRTTQSAKLVIENAADYLGVTISSFMLECAIEKAMQILQQAQIIELSAGDSEKFLAALENPIEPHLNLRKLFAKHAKKNE